MTKRVSPEDAVKIVNSFFVYDGEGAIDRWKFKSPGDCENYSLLVLKYIAGGQREAVQWLLSGKAKVWYVKTARGVGHVVLEYEGKFVDNIFQRWMDSLDDMNLKDSPRKPYSKPFLVAKLVVGAILPPW